ncbi:Uncharacterized protein TCM_044032 [Theobroma cacao]|uniref:Uncharacterized protein n=1 Tax=Theobroma cacao TaxID=3641 RepID=A0A061FQN2_THECC|nr:Uncharacterized protein TCM_044032 [Theobroma cacao]
MLATLYCQNFIDWFKIICRQSISSRISFGLTSLEIVGLHSCTLLVISRSICHCRIILNIWLTVLLCV